MDRIDKILAQWKRERPDLDTTPMGLIGRLGNVAHHLGREMERTFAQFGLNRATFDVLATLRRSGMPYALSPSDLMAAMMVTSGTMTNRIDQLEKAGLVARSVNPEDARSFLVSLTEKGFALIDSAVAAHVETQTRLVSGLSEEEKAALNTLLGKYLSDFETALEKSAAV
ncbi:MarR family transcriptional regulator [Rhizobium sp. CB3171]|uniref:MarR family winged helix-turn-helix transcriptional regulator n=1 Tax=unclassified Rhizobium TaxID=2613769 RepID=UPI000CDF30C0|nr:MULTISPECIES: MarR family transcriptional regulator [Rhizobium]AVA23356.1 MarR family transcriptional regulator PecS [Rhizobium sp. NXC24]MDK4739657.1 MarR family transcriptional regulator [Rhizobium sp. CNPSo 3464]UWU20703.1 MarR family transcriptional regulator [Rhizobium tropici]WFU01504.1 MarR family transcriptional regulator [Rhizobium sp. CB3171]